MSDLIRVAMITQNYHPIVGGAERQLAALAPLLQARGVEIHVVTRRYSGLSQFEIIDGVSVYRLSAPPPKAVASLSFTLRAILLLRRLGPDVIHAYNMFSPLTTTIMGKALTKAPVVVKILRGGLVGDIDRLKQKFLGAQRIAVFRRTVDAFIVISDEIDKEMAEVGIPAEKRFLIPNGVDTERFAPASVAEKAAQRSALGLDGGPVGVFTGRLVEEKRVGQLIGVWPAVRAAHPDARLLIVGTGPLEADLRKAAGPGVRFVGKVEDVAPYLRAADLFVLPSATEGLSNALLEALASGLPAIVTDVGGAGDIVNHGQSGWLIPSDDPASLQNAILKLFSEPGLGIRLGQHGRERIDRDYRLATVADRVRALYDHLLRQRPGADG